MALVILLSAPFVALRMYTRRYISRKLWWDDWTCLLGWIFFVALGGLMIKGTNYGLETDIWNVSKAEHKQFTKLFHDIEIVARVGMFFTKASIILLYQRLFIPPGTHRTRTWWSIWLTFWWNLLYAIALVLAVAFECVGKDALVAQGKQCVDEYAVLISASVINVTTDLLILIVPIAAIWGLHMPTEKKWRLSTVFAVGTFGLLASIARLVYQIPEADQPNQTRVVMILSLLNAGEQFIGIVVSCMPVIPAFYRHIKTHRSFRRGSSDRVTGSLVKKITNSFLGHRNSNDPSKVVAKPKDPFPLYSTRGYEELDEMDARVQEQASGVGGIVRGTEISIVMKSRMGGENIERSTV